MSRFNLIPLVALASALSFPAGATSGFKQVGGEAGFTTHAMRSDTTRSEVLKELEAWKRNPVTDAGWREVGGEAGWVFVGTNGGGKTRAAVIAETLQARRNPVSPSGWLEVGGEVGAVYVGLPARSQGTAYRTPSTATTGDQAVGGLSHSGQLSGSSHMKK